MCTVDSCLSLSVRARLGSDPGYASLQAHGPRGRAGLSAVGPREKGRGRGNLPSCETRALMSGAVLACAFLLVVLAVQFLMCERSTSQNGQLPDVTVTLVCFSCKSPEASGGR